MTGIIASLLDELHANSMLELAAVILAVAYLILAVRQHLSCWYAAFISTTIFLYVFWQVNLYMESALQVYYLVMAVYGWWSWQQSGNDDQPGAANNLQISTWSLRAHLLAISAIATATFISGQLLADTDQRLAYLDSFTTWGAVVTTYMVTKKVLENWIYWLIIDSAAIYLYLDRDLYFTALLFLIYIVIIFFGFSSWLSEYRTLEKGRVSAPAGQD